jgi:hypothetical protein
MVFGFVFDTRCCVGFLLKRLLRCVDDVFDQL